MAIEHKNITDPNRHEPKGASTATVDQVYASDGAGSGVWRELPVSDTSIMADVSNPSFIIIPIVQNCTVQSIRFVLANAITLADSTITVTRGGDAASLGTKVIAFTGSAEGTTFDLTTGSNNVLVAATHKYLKIATDGASTTTAPLSVTIKYKVS